jgi:hypothetical protein
LVSLVFSEDLSLDGLGTVWKFEYGLVRSSRPEAVIVQVASPSWFEPAGVDRARRLGCDVKDVLKKHMPLL